MKIKYYYFNNCVCWDRGDIPALRDMCNNRETITRQTFLKYIDREELREIEGELGYESHYKQGLTMAGDFYIEYFKSVLSGERVYGFRYSGIEYVFKGGEN
jgi:hypothetical protein